MTVAELIAKLQAAVVEKPELADYKVQSEGCDCCDDAGGIHVTAPTKHSVGVVLVTRKDSPFLAER